MPYFYDLYPGNRIKPEMARLLDEWLIEVVGKERVEATLKQTDRGVVQRIYFMDEETRNLFALYVSGLDLYRK